MVQVTKIRKNCMGTISFTAMFTGMRKPQEFIVYPNPEKNRLRIQSDNRVGYIVENGVEYSKGQGFIQFGATKKYIDIISNIEELKQAVRDSAGDMVGNNGIIFCDNNSAASI